MSDYSTLAMRIFDGVAGIRGCMLLSRDGTTLGAHPEGEAEAETKAAWIRFAALGEPDRSFVEFPDRTWAFVRRGGYGAFVVADVGVRPGLLVDLLDQILMTSEVERIHEREAMRLPEAPTAPSGKPRTSMHKPERQAPERVAVQEVRLPDAKVSGTAEASPQGPASDGASAETGPTTDPDDQAIGSAEPDDEDTEVDRILLAKEFAGLLQVPKDDDEATR
jgi:hypothetical protein